MTRCAGETLRAALNALAVAAPDWTVAHSKVEWVDRYNERIEDYHLPKSKQQRIIQAEVYGRDGITLLNAAFDASSPAWLRKIPAVETLRQVTDRCQWWPEAELKTIELANLAKLGVDIVF